MKKQHPPIRQKMHAAAASLLTLLLLIAQCAVPLPALAEGGAEEFIFKIAHTGDIHAQIAESYGGSSAAYLKSVWEDWKQDADMHLFTDSGDLFYGLPAATFSEGEYIAQMVKLLGYDVMTAGEDDWRYGKDRLTALCGTADIQMLCGNAVTESGARYFENEYYIKQTEKNGQTLKIGVFGVTDPDLFRTRLPDQTAGVTFTDPVVYANAAAAALRAQGCDAVIALSHAADAQQLAAQVDGVNLWLSGHAHTDLSTTVVTPGGETAYVIESGSKLLTADLIKVRCTLDENGDLTAFTLTREVFLPEEAKQEYEMDGAIAAQSEYIEAKLEEERRAVIGQKPERSYPGKYALYMNEFDAGRIAASAYRLVSGADIAFENVGNFSKTYIRSGPVTWGDILDLSPYGHDVVTKQITGAELLDILETSLEIQRQNIALYDRYLSGTVWPASADYHLQWDGIQFIYDLSKEPGSRILYLRIGTEELDLNKLYTVATNSSLAVSDVYAPLATAEETMRLCSTDQALVRFFSQDEQTISDAYTTRCMISKENCPHPQTKVVNEKTGICPEFSYSGDTVCTVCGKITAYGWHYGGYMHHYVNGVCEYCNTVDPYYHLNQTDSDSNYTGGDGTDYFAGCGAFWPIKNSPQTGDESHTAVYTALLILSASALTVLLLIRRKTQL